MKPITAVRDIGAVPGDRDAVGQPPSGPEIHVENKGDSIVVTDETAASGKRSLKITDAPGLERRYNPHCVYRGMQYEDGSVRNAFDIRVELGALVELPVAHEHGSGKSQAGLLPALAAIGFVQILKNLHGVLGSRHQFFLMAPLDGGGAECAIAAGLPGLCDGISFGPQRIRHPTDNFSLSVQMMVEFVNAPAIDLDRPGRIR